MRYLLAVLVSFLLLPLFPALSSAGQNYPEPCASYVAGTAKVHSLCVGLIDLWNFEEASDWNRFGVFGTSLHEVSGKNTANIAEILAGLDGTLSLDLVATNQGWLWGLGSLPSGSSTISVWFKLTSMSSTVGTQQFIASSNTVNVHGPSVWIETTNAVGPKGKACYGNYEAFTNTPLTICSAADSIDGAVKPVTLLVVGESAYETDGKSKLFISLNGAAKTLGGTAYWTQEGVGITDIGAYRSAYSSGTFNFYFDGKLDQLAMWGRALSNQEISQLYASGLGKPYPFSGE